MSKVQDVRNALETIIAGVLPAYKKLSDALETTDNAMQLLEKGFSVAYGGSQGVYDQWCMGQMRQQRDFRIVLTNLYMPGTDQDYRKGLETQLMEDEFLVIGALTNNHTLTGVAINTVFAFDQGLQYLEDPDTGKQFIIIILSFLVDYIEGV